MTTLQINCGSRWLDSAPSHKKWKLTCSNVYKKYFNTGIISEEEISWVSEMCEQGVAIESVFINPEGNYISAKEGPGQQES